jgi:hypothetical protein
MPFYLTDINLTFHDVSFDEVEKFISKISHQLQRLRLTTSNAHPTDSLTLF